MSGLSWREKLRRMNQRSLFHPMRGARAVEEVDYPAARIARAESVQRLQVGIFGIGAMVLLVGLASIIGGQVEKTDRLAVPEAAPTTEPGKVAGGANPLADAGVVPDIAAEPSPPSASGPSPKPLDLPPPGGASVGDAAPAQ
jgi:hypothetical protein